MTSKETRECFVYIMLPSTTQFVTAGKFVLTEEASGVAAGRFIYGKSYLDRKNAVEIDPVELRLRKGQFQTNTVTGVFGSIRDAGPDFWGRAVIEKHAGVAKLGELDYLLNSPDDRAGALSFGNGKTPPAPLRKFNRTLDLEKLQAVADTILRDGSLDGESAAAQIGDLILGGTSMGGARPKVVVEDKSGLWLTKFNRRDDKWNFARVEHACLRLAKECGLRVAESKVVKVGDRDALLVKRFDRQKTEDGYVRARMVSGLTLLGADESVTERSKWSYILLAEALRKVCAKPAENMRELFRRRCFNALISNTDDHPKNPAVVAFERGWELSPAYDLTPSAPPSSHHRDLALVCGESGRYANAANLLSQCQRFGLGLEEAESVISEMEACVASRWESVARSARVTKRDCNLIAPAFNYEGFRYVP